MSLEQVLLISTPILLLSSAIGLGCGAIYGLSEKHQTRLIQYPMISYLVLVLTLAALFLKNGFTPIVTPNLEMVRLGDFDFNLSLYLDRVSLPFLIMIAFFGNVVAFFSHRYIHQEAGFRRFFFVISFFIFGMTLAVLGANLDVLFTGWEIVGISSYLLIAYYWEREKPVENAQRVYLIYRICDVGLLVGAYFSHTVWRESSLFPQLGSAHHLEGLVRSLPVMSQWFLGGLIALSALGKSAQFPFLTWLPRALEGPTPSTAIFYGALSIHLGVYLLIRLEPVWKLIPGFALFIGAVGLISALLASLFGRSQTTIKGQIAYASSTQVGVMFVEMALGLKSLALVHFMANALFRGYQLLSAPSVVANQLQIQSSMGGVIYRSRSLIEYLVPKKYSESLYIFSLNEGFIDAIFRVIGAQVRVVLSPLRLLFEQARASRVMSTPLRFLALGCVVLMSAPLVLYSTWDSTFDSTGVSVGLAYLIIFLSLLSSYFAYEEKKNPSIILTLVFMSQYLPVVATALLNPESLHGMGVYAVSILVSWLAATYSLSRISLRSSGLARVYPRTSSFFFLTSMSLVGFPLTYTFIGEDFVLHHLVPHSGLLAFVVCVSYVLNGITVVRTFSQFFLGPGRELVHIPHLGMSPRMALLAFTVFVTTQLIPFALIH